jgi:hypothetical protein
MFDIAIHSKGAVRCDCFYPENANSVTLEFGESRQNLTIFDLPYEKAAALARLFADADTKLYSKGEDSRKLLTSEEIAALEVSA